MDRRTHPARGLASGRHSRSAVCARLGCQRPSGSSGRPTRREPSPRGRRSDAHAAMRSNAAVGDNQTLALRGGGWIGPRFAGFSWIVCTRSAAPPSRTRSPGTRSPSSSRSPASGRCRMTASAASGGPARVTAATSRYGAGRGGSSWRTRCACLDPRIEAAGASGRWAGATAAANPLLASADPGPGRVRVRAGPAGVRIRRRLSSRQFLTPDGTSIHWADLLLAERLAGSGPSAAPA